MPTIHDVRSYWQENPLLSFELEKVGSKAFFDKFHKAKVDDVEKFTAGYWQFSRFRGKRVLDVGSGPGWITVNYALKGADVYAIDLTPRAVELTKKHLVYRKVSAHVSEGNAEQLDFQDGYFDLVVSSGVLHHTPNTLKAIKECFRVLRPGGKAKITLYRKGLLHNRFFFGLTKAIMRLVGMKHPGAKKINTAKDVDEFFRQYDGADNPVGIGKTNREWTRWMRKAGFVVLDYEVHVFPIRFIPFGRHVPGFLHRFLDGFFGLMVYFNLEKPKRYSFLLRNNHEFPA
jgi:ubiquinone/menaquinone biosynthesis C-methylase UbiE